MLLEDRYVDDHFNDYLPIWPREPPSSWDGSTLYLAEERQFDTLGYLDVSRNIYVRTSMVEHYDASLGVDYYRLDDESFAIVAERFGLAPATTIEQPPLAENKEEQDPLDEEEEQDSLDQEPQTLEQGQRQLDEQRRSLNEDWADLKECQIHLKQDQSRFEEEQCTFEEEKRTFQEEMRASKEKLEEDQRLVEEDRRQVEEERNRLIMYRNEHEHWWHSAWQTRPVLPERGQVVAAPHCGVETSSFQASAERQGSQGHQGGTPTVSRYKLPGHDTGTSNEISAPINDGFGVPWAQEKHLLRPQLSGTPHQMKTTDTHSKIETPEHSPYIAYKYPEEYKQIATVKEVRQLLEANGIRITTCLKCLRSLQGEDWH